MADLKTAASIAAAANALIPMVGTLNASGDPVKQQQATTLYNRINDALTAASNLAAADVAHLLTGKPEILRLAALDEFAQQKAAAIAADQAKVGSAISFATSAVEFAGAVATGNALVAGTKLGAMLSNLRIA